MMTKMEPVKKMLRDGLTARRATASGRKGATRWEIWNGAPDEEALENYLGDLVRWRPEGIWEFQPFETGVPNTSGRDPYAVAIAAGIGRAPADSPLIDQEDIVRPRSLR